MQKLLVSGFVAITAVLGIGYGAFEYWVNLKANTLPKSVVQGKLTEITATDVDRVSSLANLLDYSPLPWHQQQSQRFTDLLEVADAAQQTFDSQKVNQLKIGHLLTLQREMENYIQRYPEQPYTAELQQELPAVRALVSFFPIIKFSAGERTVDSALRASRRGATLAALVIRKAPIAVEAIAETVPAAPTITWTKAENDVLYDYSQALQPAERERIGNDEQLKIGRQVCSWLEGGQGYWGVRSQFDGAYKGQIAGDYYHNRDAYIRFGTERLCPDRIASLARPVEASTQTAKAPAAVTKVAETATNAWNAATNASNNATAPRWTTEVQAPQYGQTSGLPYVETQPLTPGGLIYPNPGFPGGFR